MTPSNLNKNNSMQPLLLINTSPSTPWTQKTQVSGTMNMQIQRRYGEAVSLEMLAFLRTHHSPAWHGCGQLPLTTHAWVIHLMILQRSFEPHPHFLLLIPP